MALIDIATAASRKQRKWQNKKIAWNDLKSRLSRTHRTHESYQQYLAFSKPRQDEIKDVGGFVGGYLNDGLRNKHSVRHRQLLTLDIDSADETFWAMFTAMRSEEALVYSTHKHCPDSPRLRLIMPLSRPCDPDEYEALARWIASEVDIEMFDPTTFQPERLMYWPSTSKDGEWYLQTQDGKWLDVDETLALYVDWRDMSAWPRAETDKMRPGKESKRAGDPRAKEGTVGAFCRAFPIAEAISEFLPDVYEEAGEGRFTYLGGSSSSGAVVYNNDFIYSHHSTDPAGGQLLNSFDLVRVHKFGSLDPEGTDEPINKRPSYIAMCEEALKHPEVIRELDEFTKPIEAAFDVPVRQPDPQPETAGADDDGEVDSEYDGWSDPLEDFAEEMAELTATVNEDNWTQKLDRNKQGKLNPTISNMKLVAMFDKELRNGIGYNELEQYIYKIGPLPWDKTDEKRRWEDRDDAGMREYMETKYDIYHVGKVADAVMLASAMNRFHPVRDYLDRLRWDGVERLDTMLVKYLGAEDSDYTRAVTRKAFTAAVARVYKPGIKFDHILTLVGNEGLKKSSLLAEMGGPWFSDSLHTVSGKEALEQIQGSWIIEIAELAGFNRSETNAIKAFVTQRVDKYRAAYARHTQTHPRQCVFFATTNEPTFLKGHTGNRRFWPVKVTRKYKGEMSLEDNLLDREVVVGLPVDQLWAEAKHRYKEGEPLYLENEAIEAAAKAIQESNSEMDDRMGIVMAYLNMPLPENWGSMSRLERRAYFWERDELTPEGTEIRDSVSVAEIWCEAFGLDPKDLSTHSTKPIHQMMCMMPGWERKDSTKIIPPYGRQRYYERTGVLKPNKQ